jgi:death on curing protein
VVVYLSVEQILLLQELQVEKFGGARGLRDREMLESAAARPAMTFGGEDLYSDAAAKAAALMHSLVMNHPFVDGNKRVGVSAAELFFELNDFRLVATDRGLEELTLSTARGELDAESHAIWFRQRLERIDR